MLRVSPRLQGSLPSSLLELVYVFPPHKRYRRSLYLTANRHDFPSIRPRIGQRWMSMSYEPLTSLRLAIGEKNLNKVKNVYKELVTKQSLDMVTYRDWMSVAFMMKDPSLSDYDEFDEELAIHCAAYGLVDALRGRMALLFDAGDYNTIISLYDRYFVEYERRKALVSQDLRTDASSPDPIPDDITLIDDNLEVKYTPAAVAELLMFLVAACAVRDDFDGAFRRFTESPMVVRVKAPRITAFCNVYLAYQPEIAHRIREWIPELVLCRLVSRQGSLDRYLMSLATDNNITVLQDLYERVIEYCDNPNKSFCLVQSEQKLEGSDGSKQLAVPENTWGSFLRAFSKCNRHDLMGKLWNDLRSRGLVPNRYVRNVLLDSFARFGHVDKAIAVWRDMLDAEIEPNDISYGSMIRAYFRAHRPAEAIAMFDQFREITRIGRGEGALREQALLPLYNIVLHGLLTNKAYPRAQAMLEDLQERGPAPDVTTFNVFLRFHGRASDLLAVGRTLQKMKELGIDPDVYSFTTVLSPLYKAGNQDAHTHLLNIMMPMGLRPNVAMYSAIIGFLVREGGQTNLENAVSLLDHMENAGDKSSRPNDITYTSLLGGIHRDPLLTSNQVKLYTNNIFKRMRRNGILPNRTTYHYLIKACLENPEARGLQQGLQYYGEMTDRGFTITDKTWYVILSSLLRRGDMDKAVDIVNDMHRTGHQPDESLSRLVDKVRTAMKWQTI